MSGPQSSVVSSAPGTQSYINTGLTEAQRLFNLKGPDVYSGNWYVSQDPATKSALDLAKTQAQSTSTLADAAALTAGKTLRGEYLGMNPFFEGAFKSATAPITQSFQDAMANLSSQASRAGRYGSGAMQQLQARATNQLAEQLSNIGGTLAFKGYESERERQQAALQNAQNLANLEYYDINKLLSVGQAQETYEREKLAGEMAKFQAQEMQPYANLQSYLSSVYSAPAGQQVTTTYEPNKLLEGLGGALVGSTLLTDPNSPLKAALSQLGTAGTALFDFLKGQFGGGTNSYGVTPAQAAANLATVERSMGG
jgi:hypothetical protein